MRLRFSALRLDGIAARLLHEASRVHECAVDRVVTLVGHAAEHERVRRAAADRLCMEHHHVHRRRYGAGMAVRDHREAVTDDGNVGAGHLGPARRRVIRHGRVDHLLARFLRLADLADRALLAGRLFHAVVPLCAQTWATGSPMVARSGTLPSWAPSRSSAARTATPSTWRGATLS